METELLETMFGRIGVWFRNPAERTSIKRRVRRVKNRLRRRNRAKLQER